MNKKLFLSALFVGSTVVNGWAGFRNLDQLTEFSDEIINSPGMIMENPLTTETLKKIGNMPELIDTMRDIRKIYGGKYKARVDRINFFIFNTIVALSPWFHFAERADIMEPFAETFLDNELVVDFFKNPDNLSKVYSGNLINLVFYFMTESKNRLVLDDYSNNEKEIAKDLIHALTESTYIVLSERAKKDEIDISSRGFDPYYLFDIYGERGLNLITERSIRNFLHGPLIVLAAKMKRLHSQKAYDIYNNIIKDKLKTTSVDGFLYSIYCCIYHDGMIAETLGVMQDVISNFSLDDLTSILDDLPSCSDSKSKSFVAEIKDIISQQINAKKEGTCHINRHYHTCFYKMYW